MPRAQCQFYTSKNTRCTRSCDAGVDYCRTHIPKAAALGERPAEGHCLCVRRVRGANQWCGQPNREGQTICQNHWQAAENLRRRREHEQQQALFEEQTLQAYLNQNPQQNWAAVARHLRMRTRVQRDDPIFLEIREAYAIGRRYFLRTTPEDTPVAVFTTFWTILWDQENGLVRADDNAFLAAHEAPAAPPAPPMGQMGRLAADTQNVHTAVVAKQTNSNVDLLLEAGEFEHGEDVLLMLSTWWMVRVPSVTFAVYWKVMEDVRFWFEKRTCRATGDWLYRRVLSGLVKKILLTTDGNDDLHLELAKRLWEECAEAIGMCCEGHISRLANVLVGFDDAFRPPVPVGEILQSKMAAIAEMKLSHKLKLQKAVAVMDELSIPAADRAPWLEALEE